MDPQRRLVRFSGTVQGVGFRYTVIRLAQRYDVTGYVRNLPDGRVELVAEGPADQIDGLIADVRDRMGPYIIDVAEQACEATGQYASFGLQY